MSFYSSSYLQSRSRFLSAANALGADCQTYFVDSAGELAVDVAILDTAEALPALPAVVVSSGLHGVEGFFGAAVQLAFMQRLQHEGPGRGVKIVLIHALNPFGFKYLRRFNEENVDLNRNFLLSGEQYRDAPTGYRSLNRFLNPKSPPSRFEPYQLKALWYIWRHGVASLKESIVSGQYEYSDGIFYGGSDLSKTAQIVSEHCVDWIGSSERVAHIDLHTGLGPFGSYKLLLNEDHGSQRYDWYADAFGERHIEPLLTDDGTAYPVSGSLAGWMQNKFSNKQYYFLGAEFGTYSASRVLGAIRAENRVHHYGGRSDSSYSAAKAELLECFCPKSLKWRNDVIDSSLGIISKAIAAVKAA